MSDKARMAWHLLAAIGWVERALCVVALMVVVLVLFADVISRELTSAGLYWAPRVGVWANVLVVMSGFGLASAGGAHLRPRFADGWLPARWEPALITLQHALTALFCGAAALLAGAVVAESRLLGEVSLDLFLPIWPIQLCLPLALLTASLRHTLYAVYPVLRPAEAGMFAPAAERSE